MSAFLIDHEHLNMIVTWAIAILKLINCWEYQSCEHQYNAGSLPWVAMDRIKQLTYVKAGYESSTEREIAGRTAPSYGSRIYDLAPWEYSRQKWKLFLTALRKQALTSS